MWGTDPWDNCPEAAGAASTPALTLHPGRQTATRRPKQVVLGGWGGGDRLGVCD